jgi:hypothetical protein
MSQWNSPYSYLKQTKIKTFSKSEKQEGKLGPVWVVYISGSEEDIRKGYGRVNIMEIRTRV